MRALAAFVVIIVSMYLIDSVSGYYLGPGLKSVSEADYYDIYANFFQMIFITGEGFAPKFYNCITSHWEGTLGNLGLVLSDKYQRIVCYYAGLGAYLVDLPLLMALGWVVKQYRAKQWVLFAARHAIVPIAVNYMPLCWIWNYSVHRNGINIYMGVNYFHLFFLFALLSVYAFGLDCGRMSVWQLFKRWWKDANIKRGVLVFVAEIVFAVIVFEIIGNSVIGWDYMLTISSWIFVLYVAYMLFWLVNKCKSNRALLVARYAVFPSMPLVLLYPQIPCIIPWYRVFGTKVGAEFLYSLTPQYTITIFFTLLFLSALAFTSNMPKEK